MKVIFLDIDGVLNYVCCPYKINGFYFVDNEKVKLLQELVNKSGAKVVLSSTWRIGWFDVDNEIYSGLGEEFIALKNKLLEFGIKLSSRTPITEKRYRGNEIHMWLENWKGDEITDFVILDDDSDMNPYMDKLVQTSFETGLMPEHVEKALKILNGGNKDE